MGVPPTGKTVRGDGIIIYRLKDQKIVEYWGSFDTLGLIQQLGALNIMLKANRLVFEIAVLPEILHRLKTLEEKARKGVFVE